jgi:hypothetical protein
MTLTFTAIDPSIEEKRMRVPSPEMIQTWRKLSSFLAQCMSVGILDADRALILALRDALEEELDTSKNPDLVDYKIPVACEWIAHAAKILLNWAKEDIDDADLEDPYQHYPTGPLYKGPDTVCLQRWGFWQTQFKDLGNNPMLREDIREGALKAAETMGEVERQIDHTL